MYLRFVSSENRDQSCLDMKKFKPSFKKSFSIIGETKKSQVAEMSLGPDERTGGKENRHNSDQWLFVVSGEGVATVEGRKVKLSPGTLLLIEAKEEHSVACNSEQILKTLNFYAPPEC